MKNQIVLILLGLLTGFSGFAQQDKNPSFRVQVSYDTIGLEDQFEVKYILENTKAASNFQTPNFDGFQLLAGPMTGTSISIVNGDMTQSSSYSYFIKPISTGIFNIDATSIETEEGVLISDDVAVVVLEYFDRPIPNNTDDFFGRNPLFNDPFFNQGFNPQDQMDNMMKDFDQMFKISPPSFYFEQNPNSTPRSPIKKEDDNKIYKKI